MDPQLRDPSMGAALKEELARPAAASMEINENSGERRGFARAGGAGAGTGTGVGVKAGAGGSRSHGSLRAHPGRAGARAAPARPPRCRLGGSNFNDFNHFSSPSSKLPLETSGPGGGRYGLPPAPHHNGPPGPGNHSRGPTRHRGCRGNARPGRVAAAAAAHLPPHRPLCPPRCRHRPVAACCRKAGSAAS